MRRQSLSVFPRVGRCVGTVSFFPHDFEGWADLYKARARAAIMALRDATLVYRDNGMVVHELRGAPDDIWKMLLDAALSDALKEDDV